MYSSLKIGAVAGLIAGIIGGIAFTVFAKIGVSIGLYESAFPLMLITQNAFGANLFVGVIFGIICGIIYSKAYSVIPGKGLLKGLFFGIIVLLVSWVRIETFVMAYGFYLNAAGFIFTGFFEWTVYGLLLGFLYELLHHRYNVPKDEKRIVTYDLKSGIIPGAIAGIINGVASALVNAIATMTGLFGPEAMAGAPDIFSFNFWISQSGSHILINMIWGAFFGAMFARVYNLFPGGKIMKGLYYALIVFLINSFQISIHTIGLGEVQLGLWTIFTGLLGTGIIFGLVLGYLYRKPSEEI